MQTVLAYIEMRIAMLGVAMASATLDKEHMFKLLASIEDAIHTIKSRLIEEER